MRRSPPLSRPARVHHASPRALTAHPVYARVPYAHAFRTTDGLLDFVIVNVRLTPADSEDAKRAAELAEIAAWVSSVEGPERDFLIVGDMNLYTTAEIAAATPAGFLSLNDEADKTNTATTPRPYDHVMYRPAHSTEVDDPFDQQEIDLVAAMEPTWPGPGVYPGNPYTHDPFRARYSDHRPIVVRLRRPAADDN